MIVDDEEKVRKVARLTLTKAGYDVEEAEDGGKAIEVLNSGENPLMVDVINRAKIFAPFFTTKQVDKRTGLGLYVVQSLISKHGGRISVESEEGKGTTFHIQFPIPSQA